MPREQVVKGIIGTVLSLSWFVCFCILVVAVVLVQVGLLKFPFLQNKGHGTVPLSKAPYTNIPFQIVGYYLLIETLACTWEYTR